jgi:hypothetical protein
MARKEKSRKRILLGIAALLLFGPTASGCSGAKQEAPNGWTSLDTAKSTLIGRWRQTSIIVAGQAKDCPASLTVGKGRTHACGPHDSVEFRPDGTFVASFSRPNEVTGKWQLKGATMVVTFTAPAELAGISQTTRVAFKEGAGAVRIDSTSNGTPVSEIYVRE